MVEGEREGEFLVLFVGGSAAMCLDPSSIRSASVFGRGASARVSALVGSDPGGGGSFVWSAPTAVVVVVVPAQGWFVV